MNQLVDEEGHIRVEGTERPSYCTEPPTERPSYYSEPPYESPEPDYEENEETDFYNSPDYGGEAETDYYSPTSETNYYPPPSSENDSYTRDEISEDIPLIPEDAIDYEDQVEYADCSEGSAYYHT